MNIKKELNKKWSLDAKDDYQELREKVNFASSKTYNYHRLIKNISIVFASFILLIGIAGLSISGLKDGFAGEANGEMGGSMQPDYNDNKGEKPDCDYPSDSLPGSGSESDKEDESVSGYYEFIGDLAKNKINADYVYKMIFIYNGEEIVIYDFDSICNYFNFLTYQEKEEVLDVQKEYDAKIIINYDWATIYFDNTNMITIVYENTIKNYMVNTDNVLKDIMEFLPN